MESIVCELQFDSIRVTACPELPRRLHIDGREVSALQHLMLKFLTFLAAFRSHDENKSEGERIRI